MKDWKQVYTKLLLITVVVVIVFLSALVVIKNTATASSPPLLAQADLDARALAIARESGLNGNPTAKRVVQMSYAQWLSLNNAEPGRDAGGVGLTPDMPVLVVALRGNIAWRAASQPRPGQTGPQQYDNITVVLDARTGEMLEIVSKYPGRPMPVPVP